MAKRRGVEAANRHSAIARKRWGCALAAAVAGLMAGQAVASDSTRDCRDAFGLFSASIGADSAASLLELDSDRQWQATVVHRQVVREEQDRCQAADGNLYGSWSKVEVVELRPAVRSDQDQLPETVLLLCSEESSFWPVDGSTPVCVNRQRASSGWF